jgi:RNA exonuclease 1
LSPPESLSGAALGAAVSQTVQHIKTVREFLPPCTLLVVYSGTGDPREMSRLHEMQRTFKQEYASKKWDELSVKWTDAEEQALRSACRTARQGLGFVKIV